MFGTVSKIVEGFITLYLQTKARISILTILAFQVDYTKYKACWKKVCASFQYIDISLLKFTGNKQFNTLTSFPWKSLKLSLYKNMKIKHVHSTVLVK